MAEPSLHDPTFWLPSHFPSHEYSLMHQQHLNQKSNNAMKMPSSTRFTFPTEFPYEFEAIRSSAACKSPMDGNGSTETESSDEEEDFLAGLTQRLALSTQRHPVPCHNRGKTEKNQVMASSPQSTLTGYESWSASSNGSPSGPSHVSSPPATPFGGKDDTWDLISAAAGQVARLKMHSEGPFNYTNQTSHGVVNHSRTTNLVPHLGNPNSGFTPRQSFPNSFTHTNQLLMEEHVMKQPCPSLWGRQVRNPWQEQQIQGRVCERFGSPLSMPHSAACPLARHPPPQPHPQPRHTRPGMGAGFPGVSNARKVSSGTGVFLPRRYGNNSDYRKQPERSSVLLPAKVVHALNLNFDEMNHYSEPLTTSDFLSSHDVQMARRKFILMQQNRNLRSNGGFSHEKFLPQEWSY